MRIRSALAAAVLGVALTAAGAASATAHDDTVCSPYIGGIDTSSSDIFWAGAHCGDHFFGFPKDADHVGDRHDDKHGDKHVDLYGDKQDDKHGDKQDDSYGDLRHG
jgi:hypothetical protein